MQAQEYARNAYEGIACLIAELVMSDHDGVQILLKTKRASEAFPFLCMLVLAPVPGLRDSSFIFTICTTSNSPSVFLF